MKLFDYVTCLGSRCFMSFSRVTGHGGDVQAVWFSRVAGHGGWVQAVSFSPDSTSLVSVAEEDDARLWNCVTGTCVKTLEVHVPAYVTITVLHHSAPSQCSITVLHHNAPSQCSITMLRHHASSQCSITVLLHSAPSQCAGVCFRARLRQCSSVASHPAVPSWRQAQQTRH